MDKLTESSVRRLEPREGGDRIVTDASVRGFGVRVTAAGAKSYVLNYTVDGRQRRLTIGPAGRFDEGGLSVAAAREKAAQFRASIRDGHDPLEAAKQRREAPTMRDLCELYETHHLPSKRAASQVGDRAMIERHILPALRNLRVAAVTGTEINKLHRNLSATPYQANRVLSLLSKMFSLAIADRWCAANPCKGVNRFKEIKRAGYLSPEQLAKLAAVLNHRKDAASDAVKLLLLTGARRSEVLKATWGQFDLDKNLWIKPGATTKQKTEHRVPLSGAAVLLLRERQRRADGSAFVFPGQVAGQPLSDLKKPWASICAAAKLDAVRLHDLRHTYASVLVSAGMSLPIIGALLGHTQAATTHRYAHLMDSPQRAATEHAASAFLFAETGKTADVVKLKTKRKQK